MLNVANEEEDPFIIVLEDIYRRYPLSGSGEAGCYRGVAIIECVRKCKVGPILLFILSQYDVIMLR